MRTLPDGNPSVIVNHLLATACILSVSKGLNADLVMPREGFSRRGKRSQWRLRARC
ncbi:hypothetical protein BJY04DRAFT_202966 [Aspergillus karnatakaensis]|uniref:uncharacterized protein n=1 Tax=Aspergillus karnatakaensis TaxID=1810916 RepID=UPI003CCD6739